MKLYELTIQEAHRCLKQKEISSQDLTRAVLDRINAVDERVDAYITVDDTAAMVQADRSAYRDSCGVKGPHLHQRHPNHMRFKNFRKFHSSI